MLGKEIIARELATVDLDASNCNEVFDLMGARFKGLGYVNEKYLPTIKAREAKYPTALLVEPHPIAIPHTEADAIIKPFIAPVRLKEPIAWGDMSDPRKSLEVRLVFMLGFKEPKSHIELLQILIHNFQQQHWVSRLYEAKTADDFYQVAIDMDWRHD
jgi:PTS system galactitol-specific IIA component